MDIEKKLNALFKIIVNEAKTNENFAKSLEVLFQGSNVEKKPVSGAKKNKEQELAVLDPMEIVLKGKDFLRTELLKLEIKQLKVILNQYFLDPANLLSKKKKSEPIIEHIIEIAYSRAHKGNAFR
jgi:hypothetical protein